MCTHRSARFFSSSCIVCKRVRRRPALARATLLAAASLLAASPLLAADPPGRARAPLIGGTNDADNAANNAVVFVAGTLSCTGILIAPRIVVTAGHCLRAIPRTPPVPGLPVTNDGGVDWEMTGVWYPSFGIPGGVQVFFGADSNNWRATYRAFHYNHPGRADVVMLGLDRPVPASLARPAPVLTRIPDGAAPATFWSDKSFTLVGWGFTDNCTGPTTTTRRQRGSGVYGAYPTNNDPNMILINAVDGATTAQGDSGGPLFWTSNAGTQYLVGTNQQCGGRFIGTWGPGGAFTGTGGGTVPNLGAWYDLVLRQGVDWTALGLPRVAGKTKSDVKDVAVCFNRRIFLLLQNGELLQSGRSATGEWTSAGRLPADAERITCAAGQLYFQKTNRELWLVGSGSPSRLGRPASAATISGTEDASLSSPYLWALNDNRSLWRNGSAGADTGWRRIGQPREAREIAATRAGIFALNDDATLWLSPQGFDRTWARLGGAAERFVDIAAAAFDETEVVLIGLTAQSTLWRGVLRKGGGIPERVRSGENRTFAFPRYGADRLDYCFTWASQCGQPAADAFCRIHGFASATAQTIDADIGARQATYVLGAARRCNTSTCDGFASITCRG